ncbi:protein tyrosine kinase [Fragilaria crotonensis]|nr:protein tyrosine kinase [Fragilaria crotonensis]
MKRTTQACEDQECSGTVMTSDQADEDFSDASLQAQQKASHEAKIGLASYRVAVEFDSRSRMEINPIPVVSDKSIVVGQLLGIGGFNEVISVTTTLPDNGECKKVWAMKRLLPSVMETEDVFYGAALDLVLEAKILNCLSHPNIINLHGVSCDDESLKTCYLDGNQYCLYLDVFYVTVRERFDEWRKHPHLRKRDLQRRLETIALPIADAMEYLHSRNIIFRDLKPDNMGFDSEGIVKLFDFGLARETNPSQRLSSITGSLIYMAPEVAQSQPYGLSADVFSFGIFLHECCTLSKRKRHNFSVCCSTPRSLQTLTKLCLGKSAIARPTFSDITDQLRMEIQDMRLEVERKSKNPLQKFVAQRRSPSQMTVNDRS